MLDQANQPVINPFKHTKECVCVMRGIIRMGGGRAVEVNPVRRVSDSDRKPKTLNA